MKAKKLVVLLTAVCLLGTMVACGEEKGSQSTKDGQTTVQDDTKETKGNAEHYDVITEEIVRNYPTTDVSQFEYQSAGPEGIRIVGYLGTDEIVSIPEEIDGQPVIELMAIFQAENPEYSEEMHEMYRQTKVRGVYIPESVKTIGGSFYLNSYIEVVVCEAVENLEPDVFYACPNLHTLILGNSLKKIGDIFQKKVITDCGSLEEVYLPETLETIESLDTGITQYSIFINNGENFVVKVKKGSAMEENLLETCKDHRDGHIMYKVEIVE